MAPDTLEEMSVLVRTGFYHKDELLTVFCEERYEPGELDAGEVSVALDAEFQKLVSESRFWPVVTDCDRLEEAFHAINSRDVIALQNSGYTQSDGHEDFAESLEDAPNKDTILGYCFYHGQDLERAVRGGGLYIAFGSCDPQDETIEGAAVGRIGQEELLRVGLAVEWDGTFSQRIHLPHLVWQRRLIN